MQTIPSDQESTAQHEKDVVAKRLIKWHFSIEPEMYEIYRIRFPNEYEPGQPIRLLEVSNATFPTGEVMAFGFAPAGDITYPSIFAEVTPEELELIKQGKIPLPQGWDLSNSTFYNRADFGLKAWNLNQKKRQKYASQYWRTSK